MSSTGRKISSAWGSGQGWRCHPCGVQVRVGEIHVCRGVKVMWTEEWVRV